jgi:NAD(P)-dependent dehydrogenase (short-subunit alcohol dehydrogenase family)
VGVLLDGKTVIITGVGAGLGRECVTRALDQGANVVVAARTQATLDDLCAELDPDGKRMAARATDITDADACAALVDLAVERFGSVDALVQVAAYEMVWGGLHETDFDTWRTAYDTNVLGAVTLARPVARAMEAGGGGSIVLIGSQSQFKPPMPHAGYGASKAALMTTMYYLADELGAHDIRCNMVVPSWMWGPPVQGYVQMQAKAKGISEEDALHEIVGDFPLGRMTEDGEVADVVMFFVSDLAKAVTGQHLLVNCGELMH